MDIQSAFEQAKLLAAQGNKSGASAILVDVITHEPRNEAAWLLLSEVVWKKEHAIDCLERVLKLNPSNEQARRRLEELKQAPSPQAQRVVFESTPRPVQSPPPEATSTASQLLSILQPQLDRLQLRTLRREWVVFGVALSIACIVGISLMAVLAFRGATIIAGVFSPRIPVTTYTPLPPTLAYPTQSTSSTGLGVTRARIQSTFEKYGFTFERSSDIGGQPVVSGNSPSGTAMVELIGQPDNLSTADIVVALASDTTINGVYMAALMEIAAPDWKGGNDWLQASVSDMPRVKDARATHGNVQATLSYIEAFGVLTLTIEAIDR